MIRLRLARALLRTGRAAEARDLLGDSDPRDPEAAWLESRAALQLGERARAAEALGRSADYRDAHPTEPEPAPFVGSDRCAECHRSAHSTHRRSLHARTFHRPAELAGLPLPPTGMPDPQDPRLSHTFRRDGGGLALETRVDDQTFRAVVDYAFGSGDRGLTLVGRDGSKRVRELRLSRYGDVSAGWDVTTGHSAHPERTEDGLGRPLSADMARGCLFCHTTDPRSVVDGIAPASLDRAIGCERCHGPGGNHVLAVSALGKAATESSPFDDLSIGLETGLSSPAEINRLCGQCHSPRGGVSARPEDRSSVRFQATTLTWSRCYTESGEALGCLTCHDPHRDATPRAAHYESRCKTCHAGASTTSSSSTSLARTTCPVNASTGCLGCHMPVVRTPMIPHSPFTDHFIRVRR
ncbi:MAG: hypothetical protein U0835_13100 [Isosphaeraceae bacterium]